MEDRATPGLYLELSERSLADYAAHRASELGALPGVERVSWWTNANPHRTDLPRVLPEFGVLGLAEVDAGFVAPPAPQRATGLHFVRTPRPGQGRLTGRPTTGLSLVLISPRAPDQAAALRDWADFVHISEIAAAAVPGYSMITPYEHAERGDPRFLHLYEIDADDPEATFQSMTPLVATRLGAAGSPAFDAWAWHPALRIMYVNTFRLAGARGNEDP